MTDSVSVTDFGPDLALSRSFTINSSGTMADIAARVVSELAHEKDDEEDALYQNEEGDSDSEFEFVIPGAEANSSPISAGEIFANGQIKPLFPVFNADWSKSESSEPIAEPIRLPLKKLLISERETSLTASASCSEDEAEDDDLGGVNSGTYCVWTPPKQEMSKKSNSTGSSKRWKLRNLVHRSHSDGREKFVFLAPKQEEEKRRLSTSDKPEIPDRKTVDRKEEKAPLTAIGKAHRDHYLRNRAIKESDRRKSYLPYKQDLVGFFTNVNSMSRTMQPF